jgi:hypothetical protein
VRGVFRRINPVPIFESRPSVPSRLPNVSHRIRTTCPVPSLPLYNPLPQRRLKWDKFSQTDLSPFESRLALPIPVPMFRPNISTPSRDTRPSPEGARFPSPGRSAAQAWDPRDPHLSPVSPNGARQTSSPASPVRVPSQCLGSMCTREARAIQSRLECVPSSSSGQRERWRGHGAHSERKRVSQSSILTGPGRDPIGRSGLT